ncbi:hypothetical protein OROGR_002206 [Orobanche gracilis]
MASSSFGAATASAASLTENIHKSSTHFPLCHRQFVLRANCNKVVFRLSPRPKLRFSSKGLQTGWHRSAVLKAQLNEVTLGGSSKAVASTPSETKDVKLPNEPPLTALASEESISEFITQVSSLVKLVDSKDIVELELKQPNCELLIRKKEALPPPPSPPITYVQSQPQPSVLPPVSAPLISAAAPSPSPLPAPSPPKVQPSKSSHLPLQSPMAGTFYRCPAPGESPFVKVGDKVNKGQVLCIIEAMKLMNEIEAVQSGTIVEVVADDGKPVTVGTVTFVRYRTIEQIKPKASRE